MAAERAPQVMTRRNAATLVTLYRWAAGYPSGSWPRQMFAGYVQSLRAAGWTLAAIGCVLGITREAVRRRCLEPGTAEGLPPVDPPPPPPPQPVPPPPPPPKRITAAVGVELRALYARARTVNGATPTDHPDRAASIELTRRLADLVAAGYPKTHLADVLGVTHGALNWRLARHGYRPLPPSFVGQPNRVYQGRPTWPRPERVGQG